MLNISDCFSSPDDFLRKYFNSLSFLTVSFERDPGAKISAYVTCELCKDFLKSKLNRAKKIKLVKGPQQSWPVYNLTNHFDAHRSNRYSSLNKRGQKTHVVPDMWSNAYTDLEINGSSASGLNNAFKRNNYWIFLIVL